MPEYVYVTTVEGRRTPLPASEASSPGGGTVFVEAGKIHRALYSSYTRRAILDGDLVLCNRGGTKVGSPAEAEAPAPDDTSHDQADDGSLLPDAPAKPETAPAKRDLPLPARKE